ncbi:hypothetical protein OAY13_02145 [Candidatus Pelagibacter sp.]|nr:hypothetical protein [Candidatus Pelagibacter sp.]
MIKKFIYKSFLTIILFLTTNYVLAATGPATEYKVTMTKLELCEKGSSPGNCVNPLVISPSAASPAINIASVTAGAAAGSYGNIAKANIGTTYTYMQITMDRKFQITGTAGSCATKAGESGSKTADAAGQTGGTPGSSTLYVPDGTGTFGNHINGSVDSLGASVSANGTIGNSDEYFQYRKIITGGLTVTAGNFPTVKIAFDVSNAVGEGTGGAAACTANVMYAEEPGFTITFTN